MPNYDYRCSSCGHELEVFQSMSDAPLTLCPHCNKETFQRVIGGGAGVIFKGSGFYINDKGDKGKKEPSSKESA